MNFIPAKIISSGKAQCHQVEINCKTESFSDNQVVQIAIRPEDIRFNQENENDNLIIAKINEIEFLGAFQRIYFHSAKVSTDPIIMDISSSIARKIQLAIGDELSLYFSEEDTKVYQV
jgi:ABC-type Fe3+/spermidine/putrescine transport system ATPase subunit